MRRIHEKNINTPEYFDKIWSSEDVGKFFDRGRMEEMVRVVKNGDFVLDVGAGVYGACLFIAQERPDLNKCSLFAIDQSWQACKQVKQLTGDRIIFDVSQIERLQDYNLDTFDVVIAGEIIEHMEEPIKFIGYLIRICKPGGFVILSTVNTKSENAAKLDYPEHLWEFEPLDLVTLFIDHGAVKYYAKTDYHYIEFQKA